MKLIAASTVFAAAQATVDIGYRYTDRYSLIWNDGGSGANADGSFWRVENNDGAYCSLGDVAGSAHKAPSSAALLVTSPSGTGLVKPTSFVWAWDDRNSGATSDVRVWRMYAPSGFTCLGDVVMNTRTQKPDANKYCCVRDDLLMNGRWQFEWNDAGSGATYDFSSWHAMQAYGDTMGLNAMTFYSGYGHSEPTSTAKLINSASEWVQPESKLKTKLTPLKLYEVTDMKEIWSCRGTGSRYYLSVWKPQVPDGFYRIGDVAVPNYNKPVGYMLKPTSDYTALAYPQSFSWIWQDSGSGASKDLAIWRMNCPAGYGALGNAFTGSYSAPSSSDYRCVSSKYISIGSQDNLEFVFNCQDSGSTYYVSIWEQNAGSGQQGISASSCHNSYSKPGPVFLLNRSAMTYYSEKPLRSMEVKAISYHFDRSVKSLAQKGKKINVNKLKIQNNYPYQQESKIIAALAWSEEDSFNFESSVEVGVSTTFSASAEVGFPDIGLGVSMTGETTTSKALSTGYSSGNSVTSSQTDTIEVLLKCAANSECEAFVTTDQYTLDVPFSATVLKTYIDGTTQTARVDGVYKGSKITDNTVVYAAPRRL